MIDDACKMKEKKKEDNKCIKSGPDERYVVVCVCVCVCIFVLSRSG